VTQILSSAKHYSIRSIKNALRQGLGLRSSALVVLGEYNQELDDNR